MIYRRGCRRAWYGQLDATRGFSGALSSLVVRRRVVGAVAPDQLTARLLAVVHHDVTLRHLHHGPRALQRVVLLVVGYDVRGGRPSLAHRLGQRRDEIFLSRNQTRHLQNAAVILQCTAVRLDREGPFHSPAHEQRRVQVDDVHHREEARVDGRIIRRVGLHGSHLRQDLRGSREGRGGVRGLHDGVRHGVRLTCRVVGELELFHVAVDERVRRHQGERVGFGSELLSRQFVDVFHADVLHEHGDDAFVPRGGGRGPEVECVGEDGGEEEAGDVLGEEHAHGGVVVRDDG